MSPLTGSTASAMLHNIAKRYGLDEKRLECTEIVRDLVERLVHLALPSCASNCWTPTLCMASAVSGYKRSFGLDGPPGCYEDFDHTECLLAFGSNLPEQHPIIYWRLKEALEKRKFPVIVVDPRVTIVSDPWDPDLLTSPFAGDRAAFLDDLEKALYASKLVSYAQGFMLLRAAAREYGWALDFGRIALLWRGGCIIRSVFLGRIKDAFDRDPELASLLLDPFFRRAIARSQAAWRRVVARAVRAGIPVPAFGAALSFYDGYRSERLPANLTQAQRDYFGAHTYRRLDKPGVFHTEW